MDVRREELDEQLRQLEHEEKLLSVKRGKLHERVALYPEAAADLDARERELSARRRQVHAEIDALRARRSTPSP